MELGDVGRVYDRVAAHYAATFSDELDHKPADRRLLNVAASQWRGRGAVLDVGCGPGHVAAFLADRGVTAVGVDLAPAMVIEGARRHRGVPFAVGDLCRLPVGDGCAVGVVAFYSLIHLPRSRLGIALRGLRRAVRPGGGLLVAVHGGEGRIHADDFLGQPVSVDATLLGAAELTSALQAAGWTVDEVLERDPYDGEFPTRRLYVRASC